MCFTFCVPWTSVIVVNRRAQALQVDSLYFVEQILHLYCTSQWENTNSENGLHAFCSDGPFHLIKSTTRWSWQTHHVICRLFYHYQILRPYSLMHLLTITSLQHGIEPARPILRCSFSEFLFRFISIYLLPSAGQKSHQQTPILNKQTLVWYRKPRKHVMHKMLSRFYSFRQCWRLFKNILSYHANEYAFSPQPYTQNDQPLPQRTEMSNICLCSSQAYLRLTTSFLSSSSFAKLYRKHTTSKSETMQTFFESFQWHYLEVSQRHRPTCSFKSGNLRWWGFTWKPSSSRDTLQPFYSR